MKNNKKGFTLIELLAVIVVLAIIMVIATGTITNTLNQSKKGAWDDSCAMIKKQFKTNVIAAQLDTTPITCTDGQCDVIYGTNSEDYKNFKIESDANGNYILTVDANETGKFGKQDDTCTITLTVDGTKPEAGETPEAEETE